MSGEFDIKSNVFTKLKKNKCHKIKITRLIV